MGTRKRGTCTNCKRSGMALFHGDTCGSCNTATIGLGGAAKEAALAEAAKRFAGKPKMSRGKCARKVEGNSQILPHSGALVPGIPLVSAPKVEENLQISSPSGAIATGSCGDDKGNVEGNKKTGGTGVPPVIPEAGKTFYRGIFVDFAMPEDAELISRIEEFAKRERRTMSAQILYFLDKEMKFQEQECR